MTVQEMAARCRQPNGEVERAARERWDSIAKPLRGLGFLEDAVVKICALTGDLDCPLAPRAVTVFCADNGVVAQGVTQTGQEITALVAENMTRGQASICHMAAHAGAKVFPVDVGMVREVPHMSLLCHSHGRGTGDITQGPAMSRAEAESCMADGYQAARTLAEGWGCRLLAAGEMGIGNTTTSSAVASVLLGEPPEELTGRGAGLSVEGLQRKVAVVRQAIGKNRPDPADPVDVLAKVGGFDLAAMTGFYLGASASGVPVILDGFISVTAALAACRIAPASAGAMLASHSSRERGSQAVLDELGLAPIIIAGLCLGEGTGAVTMMPMLDMAAAVYRKMSTFAEIHMEAYQPME